MTSKKDLEAGPRLVADDDMLLDIDDSGSTTSKDDMSEKVSLAQRETKAVTLFRALLMLVLAAVACSVSATAFILTKAREHSAFKTESYHQSEKVVSAFAQNAAKKREIISSLAVALTSHAEAANETWPFVTLPDFERRAQIIVDLAEVLSIVMAPLVANESRLDWEKYTIAHQGWFWDGLALDGVGNSSNLEVLREQTGKFKISSEIYQAGPNGPADPVQINANDFGPYFPIWELSPVIPLPQIVNFDLLSHSTSKNELQTMLNYDRTRQTGHGSILGPAFDFRGNEGGQAFTNLFLERWRGGGNVYENGPLSYFYTPVYDGFGDNATLVAALQAFVYWQTYFDNLLHEGANGLVCVLENTCNQSFSFLIRGRTSDFIGNDDLHDPRYNDLMSETSYGIFVHDEETGSVQQQEMSDGCFYRVRVYPSKEMADEYLTSSPIIFMVSLLAVFLFTAIVFFAYDWFVERRQKLVMKTAIQSSTVVQKLFPDTVRDRLYEESQDNSYGNDKNTGGSRTLLKSFLHNGGSSSAEQQRDGNPIADEYPNCTVFFADIAGFTKWSSSRTPSEVFVLLETLYGAFDKMAKRLRVFKIETIGDCYVAVTGLPIAQERHAVTMARFAASCVAKMNQIINSDDLCSKLGDDTSHLNLRVGIHSGPVTAGVLRGEKARFQLFGDTVNTASRMESNGEPGRVHVSAATADALKEAGKGRWITPRDDPINAKGKGLMYTFWLELKTDASLESESLDV